jgi:YgiT-type zinc finger domain-containing protein
VLLEEQCSICHIGVLHLRRVTYTSWLYKQLVLMPNVAVWTCDVCGESAYDPEIVGWVDTLLGLERTLAAQNRETGSRSGSSLSIVFMGRRRSV